MIGIGPLAALLLAGLVSTAADAKAPERARPSQSLPTLFSDEDYPPEAIRNREQGTVAFRLEVGGDGKPTGCSVVSSSGSSSLDATTCRLLLERARFTPARDAQGKATGDQFSGRILWRLAADAPPRLQAAQMLWTGCVMGEAAKLAPGDLPADEVARRAFPPCAALEALVAEEVEAPVPLAEPRAAIVRLIEDGLLKVRAALKAPPEAAAPRD
jgi:TonB family protein